MLPRQFVDRRQRLVPRVVHRGKSQYQPPNGDLPHPRYCHRQLDYPPLLRRFRSLCLRRFRSLVPPRLVWQHFLPRPRDISPTCYPVCWIQPPKLARQALGPFPTHVPATWHFRPRILVQYRLSNKGQQHLCILMQLFRRQFHPLASWHWFRWKPWSQCRRRRYVGHVRSRRRDLLRKSRPDRWHIPPTRTVPTPIPLPNNLLLGPETTPPPRHFGVFLFPVQFRQLSCRPSSCCHCRPC
mmetsp:Transcript_16147/g.37168  ORF Transcript_16147/g.37168 Transcript_16147/m.37168 type:complete len:240 (-) Transcript_16147:500-1219(-)